MNTHFNDKIATDESLNLVRRHEEERHWERVCW